MSGGVDGTYVRIAADLAAVGIKANLKTEDWAKYLDDRNKAPGFDMYMIGWTGDYGDPDNFYGAYYGPNGSSDIGWNSITVQNLLEQGRAHQRADLQSATSKAHRQRPGLCLHARGQLCQGARHLLHDVQGVRVARVRRAAHRRGQPRNLRRAGRAVRGPDRRRRRHRPRYASS